jgi:peptide chain release factor 2
MGAGNFWDNPDKAQLVIHQLKVINGMVKPYEELASASENITTLAELAEDDASLEAELERELPAFDKKLADFELRSTLNGPADPNNAYLRIQAGAGGTEACDWAQMLMRMYIRWGERSGYKVEILDELPNEEAGIRSATLHVSGDYAYGHLQSEAGVHRLVRISPFDSNARRQTSFAAVDVLPEIDDSIEIVIQPDDLERQTFRSGGPGGQHQNKTESGVRFIHLPTGIAAESRTERSQHKNADNAMKLLKARLYAVEEQKRMAAVEKLYDEKGEVAFGSQIRNYVLQPYTLVKDQRTETQTPHADKVLDGDLDLFIQDFLRYKTDRKHKQQAKSAT